MARKSSQPVGRTGLVAVLAIGLLVVASITYILIRRSQPERVAVLGDSITVLTEPDLLAISHRYTLDIGAVSGATVQDMLRAAQLLARQHPRQVVLNLGTNNVMKGRPPDETVKAIQQILGLFKDAKCIHLVTVNSSMIRFDDPFLTARIRQVNEGLRQIAARDRRVNIIDWSKRVHDYQVAKEPQGHLLYDTVHPTGLGQRMLSQMYEQALKSCKRIIT
jgi:lysophospholipase L1-like esterase